VIDAPSAARATDGEVQVGPGQAGSRRAQAGVAEFAAPESMTSPAAASRGSSSLGWGRVA